MYCSENVSYPNTKPALTIQSYEKWSGRDGHFLMGEICSKIQAIIVVFEGSNRLFTKTFWTHVYVSYVQGYKKYEG